MKRSWIHWLVGGGILVLALALTAAAVTRVWAYSPKPAVLGAHYVGRQTCIKCHAQAGREWSGSDHDLAMAYATPQTVLADFTNTTFTYNGITTRFFRKGDDFYVRTDGPDGELHTYKIKYTFGVEPLQQYMVEFPDGRVQVLSIAWNTQKEQWFHLYPGMHVDYTDPLHWTNALQNWNYMCSDCHSTNVEKNYEFETDTYHTTFSEIDVSCEACHGPGSAHVEWAKSSALTKWLWGDDIGLNDMEGSNPYSMIRTCAHCHSRRRIVHPDYDPGEGYYDHYSTELITPDLYFANGLIKEEVYVYGSFLQSHMYHEGVRCTDCHKPHSLELRYQGNALCLQCHDAKFDSPEHHFHPTASAGAKCVNCHMPGRYYMQIDYRRDHSFSIPRPKFTIDLGIPNACNQCHTEKSPQWAAKKLHQWYGDDLGGDPSFARDYAYAFAGAFAGKPEAEEPLREIVANEERADIIRATAMSMLRRYEGQKTLQTSLEGLKDPNPLVRAAAIRNLEYYPPKKLYQWLTPLLDDPTRLVRTEAARVLTQVPLDMFTQKQRELFDKALDAYIRSQKYLADQPGSHLNLGVVYENLGKIEKAKQSYLNALKLDPHFIPALNNLAMLVNKQGNKERAEELLRKIIEIQPEFAEAYFSLGLLLAEDSDRLKEAAKYLKKATQLAPEGARIAYNYGLAMQKLGRMDKAEQALLRAHRLSPNSGDVLYALVNYYLQQGQPEQAYTYAEQLAEQFPDARRFAHLLRRIRMLMLRR